ncbi:ABC transporter ATP-binding protein [Trueperella pyogenes]|uniref:ABC transporter ATP-binding protein n=2 Tax=Trueperella pyogenes TaxID=1661 RepID=A0A3Q9GJY1_9ACTO|nr:ABC-F family ATP-binding cassette domain-containing protein [Trueperella pyogenes]AZR07710.1 ABC transporter ATP-binding protein [Trueperella pyogenes]
MPVIKLDNISFSYLSTPLLESVSLHIGDGERACLVGPNGCGKTTLLRIASGDLAPDSGVVSVEGVSRVPIIDKFSGTVGDYLDAALHPLRIIAIQFDEVSARMGAGACLGELGSNYDRLLAQMIDHDIWMLEARVAQVLAELGLEELTEARRNRSLNTLSPGQRGRLQLATTLIMKPEILIMDEPTNHLDVDAISFLTQTVNSWDGAVLMASHDRAFIEDTATVIYDMDVDAWNALAKADGSDGVVGLYRCAGDYSNYLVEKASARRQHAELHATQQTEKRKLQKHRQSAGKISRGGVRLATAEGKAKKFFADRAAATAKRRMQNDDKRLETLTDQEVRKPRSYDLSFHFEQPLNRTGIAVSARRAAVRGRLAPVSFDLAHGEHLLVTGANGSGKTTLLNWIFTEKPPADARASGTIMRGKPVSLVPQHLPTEQDPGFTTHIWRNGIGEAGKGILHPSMWTTPIPELSAGNQRRAQIAVALSAAPAILIIDEPTNYLDLITVQALEEALTEWKGTLVIASHDLWLINHWQGRRIHTR